MFRSALAQKGSPCVGRFLAHFLLRNPRPARPGRHHCPGTCCFIWSPSVFAKKRKGRITSERLPAGTGRAYQWAGLLARAYHNQFPRNQRFSSSAVLLCAFFETLESSFLSFLPSFWVCSCPYSQQNLQAPLLLKVSDFLSMRLIIFVTLNKKCPFGRYTINANKHAHTHTRALPLGVENGHICILQLF